MRLLTVLFVTLLSPPTLAGLLHVHVLFRHGDRTPSGTFQNDPNQRAAWPVGWGELTTEGMNELYLQGLKLKKRYVDDLYFVRSDYQSSETYFRSTDYDRTINSAYSLLAAFYKDSKCTFPANNPNWPRGYSPVPVHTVPKDIDHMLSIYSNCPKRDQLERARESNPEFQDFMAKQKDLLDYLTHKSGMEIQDYSYLHRFLDIVTIEKHRNMTLAPWITDDIVERLNRIMLVADDYLYGAAGFGKLADLEHLRINGGALLNDIIAKINATIFGLPQPRLLGYSTHDTIINGLLRIFGAKNTVTGGKRTIDYAAMFALELWEFNEKYYISFQVSANKNSSFRSFTKAIRGCPRSRFCPLEGFLEHVKSFAVEDIEKECHSIVKDEF